MFLHIPRRQLSSFYLKLKTAPPSLLTMSAAHARKKARGRAYPYFDKYAVQFGLRVTSRNEKTGKVESVVCRFCKCWGREVLSSDSGELASENDDGGGRKRKPTTNHKHWSTCFRTDNIQKHLKEQHPRKLIEYEEMLRLSPKVTTDDLNTFFSQATIEAFYEKLTNVRGKKSVVTINKAIVEVIVATLLLPAPTACDDAIAGNEDQATTTTASGDRGMQVFVPQKSTDVNGTEAVSCYTVTIANTLQFHYVVSLLGAGL